jgi:hypothetical protein
VIYRCRFGDDEAVGLLKLDAGCVAYPGDREQYLCVHHALRATPLGGMELVETSARERPLRGTGRVRCSDFSQDNL